MSQPPAALELREVSKSFAGARALDHVNLEVGVREIHGLLGHNGSGKSTLVKVLSGYHTPDAGAELRLLGTPLRLPVSLAEQRQRGLSFVHQNLGLVPQISLLENLRVAEITAAGKLHVNWPAQRRAAHAALQRFGLDLDPDVRVASLTPVERALVAIVRAFSTLDAARHGEDLRGVLVLDEPTPFLTRADVDKLFTLMRQIVAQGASVLFISHDLDEILEITDRATVLRDGRVAGTFTTRNTQRNIIVELIAGHPVHSSAVRHAEARDTSGSAAGEMTAPAFTISELSGAGLAPFAATLQRGEILGLTGLLGSGYDRVLQLLCGAAAARGGTLQCAQWQLTLAQQTPTKALQHGVVWLPGDRQGQSGAGALSVLDNLLIPSLARFFRAGKLDWPAMRQHSQKLAVQHHVRPLDPAMKLDALSGGNAQKVLLAKWLDTQPQLLLLEEPTQGVDVGAREELWQAIRAAAANGTTVLCASSDLEQLEEICDRVLVFARGRCVAEVGPERLSKQELLRQCYAAAVAA